MRADCLGELPGWGVCRELYRDIIRGECPVRATGNSLFENPKFPLPTKKFPLAKMLDSTVYGTHNPTQ